MKRLAVLTTSLLISLTAVGGGASAFAEKRETAYPNNEGFIETLTFSSLKDYDIDGDTYYFADRDTFYTYENGRLDKAPLSQSGHEFSPAQQAVIIGNNHTFNLTGTTLKVADFDGNEIQPFEGEYSVLKQFGDKAYAVKDDVLYSFDSTKTPAPVKLEYFNYEATQKISVGDTSEALKNYGTLEFVTIKASTVMTAISLTDLDGDYFTLENTEAGVNIADNTASFKEDKSALLLCRTGNAVIVAIGDSSYILHNDSQAVQEKTVNCKRESKYANATIIGDTIYASPFTVKGTTLLPNATGTIVKVKSRIEYAEVLNSVYYEVEYEAADGTLKTGYVANGHLTEYIIEDNKEPSTVPDPDYSESTRVTTVLLVFAVVVLVLIAFGYVVYSATSGKKKNGKKAEAETEAAATAEEEKKK